MTAPIEVVIDHLVLSGVAAPDVPAVVQSFQRHLVAELAAPLPGTPTSDPELHPPSSPPQPELEVERLGRDLAAAVARAVRR